MSLPFGEIRFMSGNIDSDPRDALQRVITPGLLVYGELDPQVPADQNLVRFDEIFKGRPPDHLETVVVDDAQHVFRLVDSTCRRYEDYKLGQLSNELVKVLQAGWLSKDIRINFILLLFIDAERPLDRATKVFVV